MRSGTGRKKKIAREDWPKIAERYDAGETYVSIARDYGCSPPAIRYVVGQLKGGSDVSNSAEKLPERNPMIIEAAGGRSGKLSDVLLRRATSGVASFLSALDAMMSDPSDTNAGRLRQAADELMYLAARVLVELDGPEGRTH